MSRPALIIHAAAGARERTQAAHDPVTAQVRDFQFGLIAVAADGTLVADQTAGIGTLYAASADGQNRTFVQAERLHWPADS